MYNIEVVASLRIDSAKDQRINNIRYTAETETKASFLWLVSHEQLHE